MSVKIKVSYERPDELQEVLKRLSPVIQSHKQPKGQTGRYKKAYITIENTQKKSGKPEKT